MNTNSLFSFTICGEAAKPVNDCQLCTRESSQITWWYCICATPANINHSALCCTHDHQQPCLEPQNSNNSPLCLMHIHVKDMGKGWTTPGWGKGQLGWDIKRVLRVRVRRLGGVRRRGLAFSLTTTHSRGKRDSEKRGRRRVAAPHGVNALRRLSGVCPHA